MPQNHESHPEGLSPRKTDLCDSSEPSEFLTLSHLEQSMPRGWVRFGLFFESNDQEKAVDILKKGLQPTLKAIPFLTANLVVDDKETKSGVLSLHQGHLEPWIVKDLRGTGLVYSEMRHKNFPSSMLDPDVLCSRVVFPEPGDDVPVFEPQVNIIDGGLILVLCVHHSVIDAQGVREILRVWARNCFHIEDDAVLQCDTLSPGLFHKRAHFASSKPSSLKGLPEHHPEYLIAPDSIALSSKESHRTRVYRITPSALAALKQDCTKSEKSKITTNDAVTALVWRSVLLAQLNLDQLSEEMMSRNTICVDARSRSDPPLEQNHLGSPMVYATPTINIRQVLLTEDVSAIAQAVRVAVDRTDSTYIDSLMTFLHHSVPGYDRLIPASFPNLLGTDVMTTTWYRLDLYDIKWGPSLGQIERVRFTMRGIFGGCQMIFPEVRSGEAQGMEVSVGLDEENFKKLDADPVWGKYAAPTDSGSLQ